MSAAQDQMNKNVYGVGSEFFSHSVPVRDSTDNLVSCRGSLTSIACFGLSFSHSNTHITYSNRSHLQVIAFISSVCRCMLFLSRLPSCIPSEGCRLLSPIYNSFIVGIVLNAAAM